MRRSVIFSVLPATEGVDKILFNMVYHLYIIEFISSSDKRRIDSISSTEPTLDEVWIYLQASERATTFAPLPVLWIFAPSVPPAIFVFVCTFMSFSFASERTGKTERSRKSERSGKTK